MSAGDWKDMFYAASSGDIRLLAFHVSSGVNVNYIRPEFPCTPLTAAILAKQTQAALYLLDHGADPSVGPEFDGLTPVQAAQATDLTEVLARLQAMGATIPPKRHPGLIRQWIARLTSFSGA